MAQDWRVALIKLRILRKTHQSHTCQQNPLRLFAATQLSGLLCCLSTLISQETGTTIPTNLLNFELSSSADVAALSIVAKKLESICKSIYSHVSTAGIVKQPNSPARLAWSWFIQKRWLICLFDVIFEILQTTWAMRDLALFTAWYRLVQCVSSVMFRFEEHLSRDCSCQKGQDAVLFTLGASFGVMERTQNDVIAAAIEAEVKYVVPSFFGA